MRITAKQAYEKREKQVKELISMIDRLCDRHAFGEHINWGHVGEMAQVIKYLENAADIMKGHGICSVWICGNCKESVTDNVRCKCFNCNSTNWEPYNEKD